MNSSEIRKKKFMWNDNQIRCLLKLWKEKRDDFKKHKRTCHIIENIQAKLEESCINASFDEIKAKMHNLKSKYRKEVKYYEKSPSDWLYFDDMKEIFDEKPINFVEIKNEFIFDESCSIVDESSSTQWSITTPKTLKSSTQAIISSVPEAVETTEEHEKPEAPEEQEVSEDEISNKIDREIGPIMRELLDNWKKNDKDLLENDKKLLELERRNTECLEKLVEENIKFNKIILRLLDK